MNTRADPAVNQRFDAAIILPDASQLQGGLVPTLAAQERKRLVSQSADKRQEFQLWTPSVDPERVLPKLGFVIDDARPDPRRRTETDFGVAQKLPNLGGFIVYGPRGELNLDDLRDAFGHDYVVTRDYRIYQKSEFDDGDGVSDQNPPDWPNICGIEHARALGVDGKNIRFGIVDTGIDADHREFAGRLVPFVHVPYREDIATTEGRRGFDPFGHGSHVASVIAGKSVGISHAGRLYVAGIGEGYSTTTHLRRLVRGLDWLYGAFLTGNNKGQPIILNFSLGFGEEPPPGEDADEYSKAIESVEAVIEETIDDNMLVLAAIGNDGEHRYRLPGGLADVIGVGAVDREGDQIMHFSGNVPANSGKLRSGPDLVGIGQNVKGADGRNLKGEHLYACLSGTSQATAYVAGIAGLYWSMDRRMPAREVRDLLLSTALKIPRLEPAHRWGGGLARFAPPAELLKTWEEKQ